MSHDVDSTTTESEFTEGRANAPSTKLQGLLEQRGHLLRSYELNKRLSCFKQALTGQHDLNIFVIATALRTNTTIHKFGKWFVE